jgi:hypothetical protein
VPRPRPTPASAAPAPPPAPPASLCGHRLKDHAAGGGPRACGNARCACKAFFFVVAEGAWTLRCRCKHKAVEHDARSHACAKCKGGACARFDSPWFCNCDHAWAVHKQVEVERRAVPLAERLAAAPGGGAGAEAVAAAAAAAVAAAAAEEIARWSLVQRGAPAAVAAGE